MWFIRWILSLFSINTAQTTRREKVLARRQERKEARKEARKKAKAVEQAREREHRAQLRAAAERRRLERKRQERRGQFYSPGPPASKPLPRKPS